MDDDTFEVEPERLRNRLRFLETRAEYHLEFRRQSYEHNAIAATAYRDAASIALLLGEGGIARKYLYEAGLAFLDLGLVYGAVLVSLSDGKNAASVLAHHKSLIDGVRYQAKPEGSEKESSMRPFEQVARTAARQMFALFQTECLANEDHSKDSGGYPYREALDRSAGFQVGVTGLSIESYLRMSQFLTQKDGISFELSPSSVLRSVETIANTRAEAIRSAMKDRFHWRLVPRPSVLLDFDTIILCYLALSSSAGLGEFDRLLSDEVPYFGAPVKAAQLLKYGPKQEPL